MQKNVLGVLMSTCLVAAVGDLAAQSCASPAALYSNSIQYGDTCTSANSFPSYPGGIPSPQNDFVYSFKWAQERGVVTIVVSGRGSLAAPGWVILDACDPVQGRIVASGSNQSGSAAGKVPSLIEGATYYVAVTTDPGAGQPNSNCGPFEMTIVGYLPVELQSFTVQ